MQRLLFKDRKRCISYMFSVSVVKLCDHFIERFLRAVIPKGQESIAVTDGKCATGRQGTEVEVGRRENKWGMAKALKPQGPPRSGALPLARLHPLSSPKSTTSGESDIQIFECVADILVQTAS